MTRPGYQINEEDFRRIGRQLRSRFGRAGLRHDEIEDLVQETFLHAQRQLNRGKFQEESALDTWVVAIGKKRMGKYFRYRSAQKRDAVELAIEDAGSEDQPLAASIPASLARSDPAADRRLLAAVQESLSNMSPDLRQPFVMNAAGHSTRDIADALGIPPSLVTSRVHQVRTKLRKEYGRGPKRSAS